MRILIVEDEALIAQRIERLTKEILGVQLRQITIKSTLENAHSFIHEYPIDLLILDLNLNGKDGFKLLEESISHTFHTIILSANIDKAIIAYDYGVLDFVSKPFNKERLKKSYDRYVNQTYRAEYPTKYLAVKRRTKLQLIDVEEISHIKGAGNHSELHVDNGQILLHDKSLLHLIKLLPTHFERVHKSYIANLKMVDSISSTYELKMKHGSLLPVSRSKYKEIKTLIG